MICSDVELVPTLISWIWGVQIRDDWVWFISIGFVCLQIVRLGSNTDLEIHGVFYILAFEQLWVFKSKLRLLPSATRLLCDRYLNLMQFDLSLFERKKKQVVSLFRVSFFRRLWGWFLLTRPECHRNVRTRSLAFNWPFALFLWPENRTDFLCAPPSQRAESSQRVVLLNPKHFHYCVNEVRNAACQLHCGWFSWDEELHLKSWGMSSEPRLKAQRVIRSGTRRRMHVDVNWVIGSQEVRHNRRQAVIRVSNSDACAEAEKNKTDTDIEATDFHLHVKRQCSILLLMQF